MTPGVRKIIRIWLFIGLILVIGQILLGGITRLTDSGLSITEWNIVKGTLPPLNEADWQLSFKKYQAFAKTQYENLHADMDLRAYKKIFFWEWIHRFWARSMGFIFFFPFMYFLFKKYLPKWLILRLLTVVGLAALAASFGWIMVASGLENENRTWVSAYKLAVHLSIALFLFAYLFKTYLLLIEPIPIANTLNSHEKYIRIMLGLIFVQIVFGALMAGMRAGAIHSYWPFFRQGNTLFDIIFTNPNLNFSDFINYESNNYVKAIVQIFHRAMAYILFLSTFYIVLKINKDKPSKKIKLALLFVQILILTQFVLGVLTITHYLDKSYLIPLGTLHQIFAFFTFISWIYLKHQLQFDSIKEIEQKFE